jgi:hypothetical protein
MAPPTFGSEVDLRPPYRLAPGTVVVLTGPDRGVRAEVHDKGWRASIGLGHGSSPLFVPKPLFVEFDELPDLSPAAAFEAKGCLFINGWTWDHPGQPEPQVVPSLIGVVSGEADAGMAPYFRHLATTDAPAIYLPGDCGAVDEELYAEMFRRGLMSPRLIGGRS